MILIRTGILVVFFSFLIQGITAGFTADTNGEIRAISINCGFTVDVPEQVKAKIINTLTQTLERVLLDKDGKSIENYLKVKDKIELNIIEGLNIVLEPKGYAVDSLDLDFAETTHADFVVKPFRKYVLDVAFEIDTGSFHSFWKERFESIFISSETRMSDYYTKILKGLPVNAEDSDWAFNQVRGDIQNQSMLSEMFEDMRIDVEVRIGETAVVEVGLEPLDPVAKTLRVRAYSRSVFQLVLEPVKELVTSHSNIIVGIPHSWLENSKSEIESEFSRIVSEDPLAKKFDLHTICRLYFLERDPDAAYLDVKTESGTWRLSAEMMIDVGNSDIPNEFESHLGIMLGSMFECFVLVNFFPDEISFHPDVGIGIYPFTGTFIAGAWDIDNGKTKFHAHQYLTRDTRIEAEVFTDKDKQDQYGFVYKPFQYVSFGVFSDGDDDYWLRAAFAF